MFGALLYCSHVNEWLLHIFHLVLHIPSLNVSISSEIFQCSANLRRLSSYNDLYSPL